MNANKYASVTKWQAFCKTLSAYWCSATQKKSACLVNNKGEICAASRDKSRPVDLLPTVAAFQVQVFRSMH